MNKPPGNPPKADEPCPLCKAPPNVAHRPDCPWLKWANERKELKT
jgi:hypothetical protein